MDNGNASNATGAITSREADNEQSADVLAVETREITSDVSAISKERKSEIDGPHQEFLSSRNNHRVRGFSQAFNWKRANTTLLHEGIGAQKLAPPLKAARTALKKMDVRQKGTDSMSRSAWRNLDVESFKTTSAAIVATNIASLYSMAGQKHATAVQKGQRLRKVAKLKLNRMPEDQARVNLRSGVVKSPDESCSSCPSGVGLACFSSSATPSPETMTTYGSLDNTTFNSATVGLILPDFPAPKSACLTCLPSPFSVCCNYHP